MPIQNSIIFNTDRLQTQITKIEDIEKYSASKVRSVIFNSTKHCRAVFRIEVDQFGNYKGVLEWSIA